MINYFSIIIFSFGNLTLVSSAYLSSVDLYPTAITTVAVYHILSSSKISSYFAGSKPSIGQASISIKAQVSSRNPIAI